MNGPLRGRGETYYALEEPTAEQHGDAAEMLRLGVAAIKIEGGSAAPPTSPR
ncbi:hypothetical protein [Parasulfuritortus cantonensis]|uniref:hypothetical protein n=1 Tax=Parasulfuritortus cantonensis TaxID=2528202 RepID=UPI001F1004BE|nr:hypothetical protein [Parasulfuritortus cantonensis]